MPLSRARIALRVPIVVAFSELYSLWPRHAHRHPLGLTVAEPTMPRRLGSYGGGRGLTDMSLVYGYPDPSDFARPLIEVMTCFSAAHCDLPSLKEALTQAEHRDGAWARGEWAPGWLSQARKPPRLSVRVVDPPRPFGLPFPEASVPPSGFADQDRAVVIDGEQRVITAVSFRHYEALSFGLGTKVVTAVARFGFPDTPSFYTVDDLGPYVAGLRRSMLDGLRRREA